MDKDKALREHVLYLLRSRGAHLDFEEAVASFPPELRGKRTDQMPYSPWQLLEHLRITQWDILEFSRNPKHVSPEWPKAYWPESAAPPSDKDWDNSVETFRKELKEMQAMVNDPATDLYAKIPHGDGQTILREALLVADHNAYHLGQFILLRKLLGAWPPAK